MDGKYSARFKEWLRVQLRKAYLDARKNGKRKTQDEQKFENNEDENLENLLEDILSGNYRPSRGTVHIVHKPVMREIFAAPFRDRVVHHLIYNLVYSWWDRQFIYDSYSCRVGKGTLMGIMRLQHHINAVLNRAGGKSRVVIMKFDIQGFFMSMPRKVLLDLALDGLDKQYRGRLNSLEYKMLKFLWTQIIMDDPVDGVRVIGKKSDWDKLPPEKSLFNQPYGIGIVIGNLTSQLLSNIFLNGLDRLITMDLGYKHYGRYVDDFYIVVSKDELLQLKRDVKVIEGFLKSRMVKLHPKKRVTFKAEQGVPFLGAVVFTDHVLPGKRLRRNFRNACEMVECGEKDIESVISYLGHVEHFDHVKFASDAFEKVGWNYRT